MFRKRSPSASTYPSVERVVSSVSAPSASRPSRSASSPAEAGSSWRASNTPSIVALVSARAATSPVKLSRNGSGSRDSGTGRRLCPGDASVASRLDAITARSLGLEQGVVRRAEEPLIANLLARGRGDPGRDGNVQVTWAGVRYRLAHPLSHIHGLVQGHARQQDQEFLAPDPIDELEAAQGLADLVGRVAQHRVTALVAVGVVHAFEAVEVEQHEGHRPAGEASLLLDLHRARLQRGAVEEAGEGVQDRSVAVLELTLRERAGYGGDAHQQGQSGDQARGIVH